MASEWIHSKIKLSIGILVSNRIDTIRRCMDSLVPLLQAVSSELIVLDTVGEETDGSIEVAREYTDKIYRYQWCNDFADARNHCIEHAKGEWFLFLDDDEWFGDVEDLIHFFQSGESEQYNYCIFNVRNYVQSGGFMTTVGGRMIRRKTDTHFVGRVHEHFNEAIPPTKQLESPIYHTGYLYANKEQEKKHQQRNIVILRKVLEEEGKNPNLCAQMAQELLYCEDTCREGFDYCMECMSYYASREEITHPCIQWVMVASVRYFLVQKDYEGAFIQEAYVRERFPLIQMAELALAGVCLEASVHLHQLEKVVECARRFASYRTWTKQNSERAIGQLQLDFTRYSEDNYAAEVFQAGATAANLLQQYETAYAFWLQLPWKAEGVDGSKYQVSLLETLRKLEDKTPLILYYRQFFREEVFLPENRRYLPLECRMALEKEKQ